MSFGAGILVIWNFQTISHTLSPFNLKQNHPPNRIFPIANNKDFEPELSSA